MKTSDNTTTVYDTHFCNLRGLNFLKRHIYIHDPELNERKYKIIWIKLNYMRHIQQLKGG